MTDIKQWIKGIETLEPPKTWERRSAFVSPRPKDHVRRVGTILVAGAIALAGIAFAVVALKPTGSLPPAGTSDLAPSWLRTLAQQAATNNGDPEPDTVLWGLVSVAQADPLVGLVAEPGDARVREFLVVLTGHFVCHSCKGPAGAGLPRGHAIVFTANPGTHSISDFSVLGEIPSVAKLHLRPLRPDSLFSSAEAPWTFPLPQGWAASTVRSAPDPSLKAGVLITYATNVSYRFDLGFAGPNGGGGATEALGRDAVVVEVELLWSPADEDPMWSPADAPTTIRSPSVWHDDASNPGWAFRERRVCRGETCVWVNEWHGPDASPEAIGTAQTVAESMELKTDWTAATVPAPERNSSSEHAVPSTSTSSPSITVNRYFFSASGLRGVLEVSSSPSSICYSTQSSPARPISIIPRPSSNVALAEVLYPHDTDFCNTVQAALAAALLADPSGYQVRWRPRRGGPTALSSLTPESPASP